MFDDDQETPNTLTATYEFGQGTSKKMMVMDVRHWMSNHEAGIGDPKPGNTVPYSTTVGDPPIVMFEGAVLRVDGPLRLEIPLA